MALFGYPVGQENDAKRAARAALSIQRALGEVNCKGICLPRGRLRKPSVCDISGN
jgi:hypothetical protein